MHHVPEKWESARFFNASAQPYLRSTLTEVCQLLGIPDALDFSKNESYFPHLQVRQGQRVHLAGQAFEQLFVVHSGFLKTALLDASGDEQVISFPMQGDLIGADGIAELRYPSETTALSDAVLIPLPIEALHTLGRTHPKLPPAIYGLIGHGLQTGSTLRRLRACANAQARMAGFLLYLAERYAAIGYSDARVVLRMSRADIGSFMCMTVETVSRALSALDALGLIEVQRRTIILRDRAGLIQHMSAHEA